MLNDHQMFYLYQFEKPTTFNKSTLKFALESCAHTITITKCPKFQTCWIVVFRATDNWMLPMLVCSCMLECSFTLVSRARQYNYFGFSTRWREYSTLSREIEREGGRRQNPKEKRLANMHFLRGRPKRKPVYVQFRWCEALTLPQNYRISKQDHFRGCFYCNDCCCCCCILASKILLLTYFHSIIRRCIIKTVSVCTCTGFSGHLFDGAH